MRRAAGDRVLFDLLGVDERASWDEVRRAFRAAVRASHPDLHTDDPGAEQRLKALNAVWESVNTPGKWAQYVLAPVSRGPAGGMSSTPSRGAVSTLGRLRVQRQRRGSAGLLSWMLELDGEVITSVRNGGVSILDAAPGRHSLRVFYGSRSSLPLQLELHRRQELLLGCRQIESLRTTLFSPERSLVLELLGSGRLA